VEQEATKMFDGIAIFEYCSY